ncbi:MAG: hypothetical protein LBG42_01795 [Treponema sp.]|jgi:hypothetical protein|nr:hypothetical protein [Treponema sp.]
MIQKRYIIIVFLFYNFQIFAVSQREEKCVIVNKTNSELFLTVTYFDDIVDIGAMSKKEIPVYENEAFLEIWGRHSPRIKKASYVLRNIPDWNGEVIFSMWERRGKEKELTHLQLFHRLVEDIGLVQEPGWFFAKLRLAYKSRRFGVFFAKIRQICRFLAEVVQ